jgi:hypothetical protein
MAERFRPKSLSALLELLPLEDLVDIVNSSNLALKLPAASATDVREVASHLARCRSGVSDISAFLLGMLSPAQLRHIVGRSGCSLDCTAAKEDLVRQLVAGKDMQQ